MRPLKGLVRGVLGLPLAALATYLVYRVVLLPFAEAARQGVGR